MWSILWELWEPNIGQDAVCDILYRGFYPKPCKKKRSFANSFFFLCVNLTHLRHNAYSDNTKMAKAPV